ncbi:MAG TPA: dienelactone hydrolase family protein [Rhodocyclaceae bacterium]|nr:dienelactone hydrolase family protein [Rhodocyclaceae bacterium]
MAGNSTVARKDVIVALDDVALEGFVAMPPAASGLVIFAHGSGSSRFSSRNNAVAEALNRSGLATLLFDLLTADENEVDLRTRRLRFDIGLLTRRVVGTIDWVGTQPELQHLRIGLFGASTGAAAALAAAAARTAEVAAVVSRGGRPDLAGDALTQVHAPTLLIVGGRDPEVIELNRLAADRIGAPRELRIVPHATHLFEEPGTLEEAASLACTWFLQYLS